MELILPTNDENACVPERMAEPLEAQDANPFRVSAYRAAAHEVRHNASRVADLAVHSRDRKLEDLPHIGRGIARSIREFVHSRRLRLLDRLEGETSPETLFTTVPSIGEELAHRIHDQLHVETLEELE